MPIVGNVLKGGGAFFIRRSFAGDELYPVLIKEYVEQLLINGKNLKCFVEGTRSRTGKLLPPKLGILKYLVDTLVEKKVEDIYICPVNVQYDNVVEAETFVSELLGKPKEAESLMGLLSGAGSVLSLQMGRIDVRFKTPWSLRGFIDQQVKRREAPGPNGQKVELDLANNNKHKIILLRAFGYRALADINQTGVIMPAALVGTIMLTLRGRGVGRVDLIKRVEWLRSVIIHRGYNVADFGQMSTGEVVDRALASMKGMVEIQTADVMEPTFIPAKRFELSFYRNQVIHIFVSEALLSVSLYIKVKEGGGSSQQRMSKSNLIQECGFISHLLRNEFVYGTDSLEANVANTIESMCKDEVFQVFDNEEVGLTQKQRDIGRRDFDVFLFLIWPFIEGYWLAACSLLLLAVPDEEDAGSVQWFAAKDFEKRAQVSFSPQIEMKLTFLVD
jgi:glycerol-3-phosphate O-acyltransferase